MGGREGSLLERQVAQLSRVTVAVAVIAGAATLVLAQAFHRVVLKHEDGVSLRGPQDHEEG